MPLNILHTADWHLGAKLYNASREEEHRRFLVWILEQTRALETDVLVVAGDIFHYTQPSAEATALYYHFLARAAASTGLRHIIMVGGNHDSASRLDAPREVLDVLNVHVVGGLSSQPDTWERCVCPITDPNGDVEAVVVAIPFVHEFRLGVRTAGMPHDQVAAEIKTAFTDLYTQLADKAEADHPGVPLIATGHLTVAGAPVAGYNTPIHLTSMIGGLPADQIFDPRYSYIALGHIHQMYNATRSRAWYSGSPLALNILEARSPRYILDVTVGEGDDPRAAARVEPVAVPCQRQIIELRGSQEEVSQRLDALDEDEHELPPYVWVDLHVDHYTPDVAKPLLDTVARAPKDQRPRLVRVGQSIQASSDEPEDGANAGVDSLRELDPEDVFARMYRSRNNDNPPRQDLLNLFQQLYHDVNNQRDQREGS